MVSGLQAAEIEQSQPSPDGVRCAPFPSMFLKGLDVLRTKSPLGYAVLRASISLILGFESWNGLVIAQTPYVSRVGQPLHIICKI